MADPITAGGGTGGLRDELLKRMSCASGSEDDGGDCTCRAAASSQAWQEHDRLCAYRLIREAETALAHASAEQARVEAEVGRLKSDKALLLDVIEDARAEADLAWADEAEGVADFRTRKVRSASMRDALNGVGSPEKRQALGFSVLKLPEPPDA